MDNTVDNFRQDLKDTFFYSDLILAAIVDNTVDISALSDLEILAAELILMDTIAYKVAGPLTIYSENLH